MVAQLHSTHNWRQLALLFLLHLAPQLLFYGGYAYVSYHIAFKQARLHGVGPVRLERNELIFTASR